ncbi:MAG: hypothetical protein NTW86_23660, partial [Candidatus Sumerlaeota bacterium]|nr:hypothetical protein [Candidatus Sumerlaeota bacterium]
MHRFFLGSFLLLAYAAGAAEAASAPTSDQRFEKMQANFDPVKPNTSARDLFRFALEAADAGWRPEVVEKALAAAEDMQDRDPQSSTYGNFRWYMKTPKVVDKNAVEFSMERAALLWKLHKDKLTDGARERLKRLMDLSVEGIRRHKV